MSQTLYEEAIAEARRLTEMAEQNAKNKIIDAVTPQIKRMIEAQLLSDNEPTDEEMVDDEEDEEEMGDQKPVIDLDSLPPAQMSPGSSMPGVTSFNTDPEDGSIEIETNDFKIEIEPKTGLDEALASSPASRRRLRDRIVTLEGKVRILKKALGEARGSGTAQQKQRLATIFEQLAREAASLRKQVALTEGKTGGRTLETNIINSIIKEMNHMSRRANKNVFDFLFEADEDKPAKVGMDMDMNVDAEPAEEMAAEEPSEEMSLADIADQLAAIQDAVEKLASEEQLGEEESDENEAEAEDEDEAEAEDEDEDEMEEGSAPAYESDDVKEMQGTHEGEMYEIDEAALRSELRRLRRINEADAVSGSGASSFGGGKATDDMFVDVDEETLLNALADELGSVPRLKKAPVTETRRTATRSIDEAAVLRRQVADYRNVAGQLKQQLVEMNLFNAKLLYANKLMQNRDLSAKQQRAIVEALDNAKTLREAKLLYKSLTASLTRAANSGSLTEGRAPRILGSSSKSARSAQPNLVTEGVAGETGRWALLAGIKKD